MKVGNGCCSSSSNTPPLPLKEFPDNRLWRGLEQGELETEHLTNQDMSRLLKQAQSGPPIQVY